MWNNHLMLLMSMIIIKPQFVYTMNYAYFPLYFRLWIKFNPQIWINPCLCIPAYVSLCIMTCISHQALTSQSTIHSSYTSLLSIDILKPMYSFGKWWKWKISLMGFVYRVVWVLKALWIFLSVTINFLRKLHKTNIFGMPPKSLP